MARFELFGGTETAVPPIGLAVSDDLSRAGTDSRFFLSAVPAPTFFLITGSGFAYEGSALPVAGTITTVTYMLLDDQALWRVTGLALEASLFRDNLERFGPLAFAGADSIIGSRAADQLFGYDGNDLIVAGAGDDTVAAGPGDDVVQPGAGADVIDLGAGNDRLRLDATADPGVKTANGGDGTDWIVAGGDRTGSRFDGFEVLGWVEPSIAIHLAAWQLAGFGTVALGRRSVAEANALVIKGGGFVDLGAFALTGGAGDTLTVTLDGPAAATLRGRAFGQAAPADSIRAASAADDRIATFGGADTVLAEGGNDVIWTGADDDLVEILGGSGLVFLDAGNDRATGGATADTLDGGLGADTLLGGEGNDLLVGDGGADSIDGGRGNDLLFGGDGDDTIEGGRTTVFGAAGENDDTIHGGAGNDVITIGSGLTASRAFGDDGADTITASGFSATIEGGAGDDLLIGSDFQTGFGFIATGGLDTIRGGDGNDRIEGRRGPDLLFGDAGADTFAYDDGHGGVQQTGGLTQLDVIADFDPAEGDRIDLSAVDADALLAGDQAFSAPVQLGTGGPIGAGSLRYSVGATETLIQGSTDADAAFEFGLIIRVPGYVPSATDFIL